VHWGRCGAPSLDRQKRPEQAAYAASRRAISQRIAS
jgi:hypothetical protein